LTKKRKKFKRSLLEEDKRMVKNYQNNFLNPYKDKSQKDWEACGFDTTEGLRKKGKLWKKSLKAKKIN